MTGGAFGSLIAQWIRLTDAERTTLLVPGGGGMSATFASPVAAILLASNSCCSSCGRGAVPVGLRAQWRHSSRDAARFRATVSDERNWWRQSSSYCSRRVVAGCRCWATGGRDEPDDVCFEDMFERLPVHCVVASDRWSRDWSRRSFLPTWPGGGYDNIAELLRGNAPIALIGGILLAKSLMWAFSLGSGTSGGVLAPLLMIGGAAGALADGWAPST